MRTHRHRGQYLTAIADTASSQHGGVTHGVDDLWPQHDRTHIARVTATFAALRDDEVEAGFLVLHGLLHFAAQRADQTTAVLHFFDDLSRRGAERVGNEFALRAFQCDFNQLGGDGFVPAQQAHFVVFVGPSGYAVVGQQFFCEVAVLLRHHALQHVFQLGGVHFAHAFVFLRDYDVHTVNMIADVLVDPIQLLLELLRREADSAQYAQAAGFGHRNHNVAAVRKREDRHLDAQFFGNNGLHGDAPRVG